MIALMPDERKSFKSFSTAKVEFLMRNMAAKFHVFGAVRDRQSREDFWVSLCRAPSNSVVKKDLFARLGVTR
jgi:hypothetical protein